MIVLMPSGTKISEKKKEKYKIKEASKNVILNLNWKPQCKLIMCFLLKQLFSNSVSWIELTTITKPVAMAINSPSAQMVLSKYHFPLKGMRAPWRTGCFQIQSRTHTEKCLEHLSYWKANTLWKTIVILSKELRSHHEEAPSVQKWNNVSIKNNES